MKFKRKYVKFIIFIMPLMLLVNCKPLSNRQVAKSEPTPQFKNQGEQEIYWARQFFDKQYIKEEYSKFNGEIRYSNSVFQFGEKECIYISDEAFEYKLIFQKGLLYPNILDMDTMKICCLEELTFFPNNPKIKRFKFLMWHQSGNTYSLNPDVYLFELTNEEVEKDVSWETFIENAKLTFIKYGWSIL